MKKIILILTILAAPMFAAAEENEYTLELPGQEQSTDSVTMDPQRRIERDFNFGRVWVGQRRVAEFVLGAGRFPLRIWGMNVNGRFFDGRSNCPSLLLPYQRCVIRVIYMPWREGFHHGRLRVWVGDDRLIVHLYGRARDRHNDDGPF